MPINAHGLALRLAPIAFLLCQGSLLPSTARGAEQVLSIPVELTRKIVVFPFKTDSTLAGAAEQSWWRTRELLTEKKRFLVASKHFLLQKEAFQPRGELKPEDASILGKLLDADALITGECIKRTFNLKVYEAKTGRLLFDKKLTFHPSLRATDQFEVVAERLTQDFISSVPYQGFVVVDPMEGKPVYQKGGERLVAIDPGTTDALAKDMDVQFIKLREKEFDRPLFQGGADVEVVAEGKIKVVKPGVIEVGLDRIKNPEDVTDKTLVRIPHEAQRVAKAYGLAEESVSIIQTPLQDLTAEKAAAIRSREKATFFSTIGSILAVILFAL